MSNPTENRLSGEELDARIDDLTSHIHHSRYPEAGDLATQLWEQGVRDLRILGAYLYGAFLRQGVSALPDLFQRITTTLTQELADFGPPRKKPEVADSTLGWLLSALQRQIIFHQQQQDVRWTQMTSEAARAPLREALQRLPDVSAALSATIKRPRSLAALRRAEEAILSVYNALGPVPTPPPPAPPSPAVEDLPAAPAPAPDAPLPDAALPAVAPPPLPLVQLRAPGAEGITLEATPALLLLLRKLAAVETLIEREDFVRAAVVVSDVQDALEHFDPRDYFPQLFTTYSSLLAQHMASLEPCLEGLESRSGKALQQLLQVDLERFLLGAP